METKKTKKKFFLMANKFFWVGASFLGRSGDGKQIFLRSARFNTCIVYSPRAGDIQPAGDKVLMSTGTSCHFGHLLLVSDHRRQWFLKNPLFYLFPI